MTEVFTAEVELVSKSAEVKESIEFEKHSCCDTKKILGCVCCCLLSMFIISIIIWYALCGAWTGDDYYVDMWNEMPAVADTSHIVIVGDSNLDYWDDPEYCGIFCSDSVMHESLNIAIEGSTCGALSLFAEDLVTQYSDLDWYIIHCGPNDIEFSKCGFFSVGGVTADEAFASLKRVVDVILDVDADVRILFYGALHNPYSYMKWPIFDEYDDLVRNYALEHAGDAMLPPLVFIDSSGGFDLLGNPDSIYADDMIHMSVEGYAHWSAWSTTALNATNTSDEDCVVWVGGVCSVHASDL